MVKTDYTREELIELCNIGVVTSDKWFNRDSCDAQKKLHLAKLTLMGGCKFKVMEHSKMGSLWENRKMESSCVTDDETIWIEIFYDDWEDGKSWHGHYIPTKKRLEDNKDGDWY